MSYRRKPRRGATIIEFAVIAPVLFATLLGMIEIGRGFMAIHLLNNAAQAGCRVGILQGKSNSDISSTSTAALTAAGIQGETATVLVNDGSTDAANAVTGDEITVKVTVPVTSITWIPIPKFLTGNLGGQYTMRRQ